MIALTHIIANYYAYDYFRISLLTVVLGLAFLQNALISVWLYNFADTLNTCAPRYSMVML